LLGLAKRGMLTLVGRASIRSARVAIVALGILAAFGAADTRAAQFRPGTFACGVLAQRRRTDVGRAGVAVVAVGFDDAGLLVAAVSGRRAVFHRRAIGIVRGMTAGAGETEVVRAFHAIVAIAVVAALPTGAAAALLGRSALGCADAGAVGSALVDGTRVAVVAIFGALASYLVMEPTSRLPGARVAR
jgi:hypothetical protein